MNQIVELERKAHELTSDIEDVLHAATLNFQAISSEAQHPSINTLNEEFQYLANLLTALQKTIKDRPSTFMAFLIIKQIQDEQARVRKERLVEYEEKIYDQKRILTDKETFFENLQRPKRKRPSYQSPQQFHEMRAKEREAEQRQKSQQLIREITQLHSIKRLLVEHEKYKKKSQLEQTKSSSISQVNMTIGEMPEVSATERIITFDRKNKENRPAAHSRAASMEFQLKREPKKEQTTEDYSGAKDILSEIEENKTKNQELHKIYDQSQLSLKFKQNQTRKIQSRYNQAAKELSFLKMKAKQVRKQAEITYGRVLSPIRIRRSSLNK